MSRGVVVTSENGGFLQNVYAEDCLDCETKKGLVERMEREILFGGNLTDEQRPEDLGNWS